MAEIRHRLQVTLTPEGDIQVRHYADQDYGRGEAASTSVTSRDVPLTRALKKAVHDLLARIRDANKDAMEAESDRDTAQLHHLTTVRGPRVKLARVVLSDTPSE